MIKWREAYERLKVAPDFLRIFGSGGKPPAPHAFRFLSYVQAMPQAAGAASPIGGLGATVGPRLQTFPAGAVILGITATAYQEQTATGAYQYSPSNEPGRRDLFALSFQYTNDELITPGGLALANALLGSGEDTIFPGKELLIPPSQGILASVASHTVAPALFVHIVYHCMVPRAVG